MTNVEYFSGIATITAIFVIVPMITAIIVAEIRLKNIKKK